MTIDTVLENVIADAKTAIRTQDHTSALGLLRQACLEIIDDEKQSRELDEIYGMMQEAAGIGYLRVAIVNLQGQEYQVINQANALSHGYLALQAEIGIARNMMPNPKMRAAIMEDAKRLNDSYQEFLLLLLK
ncbi:hypothetical protein HYU11_02260 [Candidatus Woesearchaeota archaeon]|nr:hypothetical protein [Candidatus Woesearchaeota archaeon]